MSLHTQIYRSLAALPLLLVALMASLQSPDVPSVTTTSTPLAARQLQLPLLAAPGTCPLPRPAVHANALVTQLESRQPSLALARCRA